MVEFENELQEDLFEHEIRIIPMSKAEFNNSSIEDVQVNYFMDDLINNKDCLYYYLSQGINCNEKDIFLFQYDNHIIASAIFLHTEDAGEYEVEGYKGAWKLEKESIQVFNPITLEEIKKIVPKIKYFGPTKHIISDLYLNKIHKLITAKKTPTIPEEIIIQDAVKLPDGAKKQITVNSYERNPIARQMCINYYKNRYGGEVKCQICGFSFEKYYGEEFRDKIHVHHIVPLSQINNSYEVDPIHDLLPVCPNCHMALHTKIDGKHLSADELKERINNCNINAIG